MPVPSYKSSMSNDEVDERTNEEYLNTYHSHQNNVMLFKKTLERKAEDYETFDHTTYVALLRTNENYKARPYQSVSPSKKIVKPKGKPFPPCTHCGFNDHRADDCRTYPECEVCESNDHSTPGYNCVIYVKRGVLAESSQLNDSSIGLSCNTCRSIVHSTSNHNEFDHFKERHIRELIWYLDSGCSRSMIGVKSYLHKYMEQPGPKYQTDFDITYYTTPHNRSLTELINVKHIPEVIIPMNNILLTEENEGPIDLINIEGTNEQIVQTEQNDTQITEANSVDNTKTSVCFLTRIMAAKLTAASASECLFADFLEIEPKKGGFREGTKTPGMGICNARKTEQKTKFGKLFLPPRGKSVIGSKWVFRNKKDAHGIIIKNKARLVAQGYNQKKKLTMMKPLHLLQG
ncbi:retrovirus-related pol polyprotein from transposon TNT 1-94 [Tanacetum coccineum]